MRIKLWLRERLRNGIIVSISIPAFAATVLAFFLTLNEVRNFQKARYVSQKIELVRAMKYLVHEQQKERGNTSVFLASGGVEYKDALAQQRALTDQAIENYRNTIISTETKDNAFLLAEIELIDAGLEDRESLRSVIDRQEIPAKQALDMYTEHNAHLLRAIKVFASASTDTEILTKLNKLVSIMNVKEYSGIERAIGSAGFAENAFSPERITQLTEIIARQQTSLKDFSLFAVDSVADAYEAVEELPATQRLLELREMVFGSPTAGDLQAVNATEFFDAATERIEGLRQIENLVLARIEERSRASIQKAVLTIGALVLAIVATFLVSLYFAVHCIRLMLSSVREISEAADELANGNEDTDLPDHCPMELTDIVMSINFFRCSVAEAQAREAQIVEERRAADEAVRAEQDRLQKAERENEKQEAEKARAEKERMDLYAKELSDVVAACASGDFSRRLTVREDDGVLAEISAGLNQISDTVANSLDEIENALMALANGDMTYRMEGEFKGVFQNIVASMDTATRNMSGALSDVAGVTESVSSAAQQVSATTSELAETSEQNATMLQSTAGSIDGISGSISTATDSANSANKYMSEVAEKADRGREIAQDTMNAMSDIQSSSLGIVNILKVIEDISFQTNLLALNAGVEAARAGEAGRGFAVVASEVRTLAQRSSDSSREISQLIDKVTSSIDRGVDMVDQTVGALNDISTDMQSMNSQIEQIATTFEETRRSVGEVSSATANLGQASQQNATMLREANIAVQALDKEARTLKTEVSGFTFDVSPRVDTATDEIEAA